MTTYVPNYGRPRRISISVPKPSLETSRPSQDRASQPNSVHLDTKPAVLRRRLHKTSTSQHSHGDPELSVPLRRTTGSRHDGAGHAHQHRLHKSDVTQATQRIQDLVRPIVGNLLTRISLYLRYLWGRWHQDIIVERVHKHTRKKRSIVVKFVCSFFLFLFYCIGIVFLHNHLPLPCKKILPVGGIPVEEPSRRSMVYKMSAGMVGAASLIIILNGSGGLRLARDRIEAVKQNAAALAYSFLRTTNTDTAEGYTKSDLDVIIYDCLALLTMYPVCLLQHIYGNRNSMAVVKHCLQAAQQLKAARDREPERRLMAPDSSYGQSLSSLNSSQDEQEKDFFQILSVQLQKHYEKQSSVDEMITLTPQHIIFKLRANFENMVERGNLDDWRTPIVRENIDIMGLAGRECLNLALDESAPIFLLTLYTLASLFIIFSMPIYNCDVLVPTTDPTIGFQIPSFSVWVTALEFSLACGISLVLLDEVWRLWNPFGWGIGSFSVTLSLAKEIDSVLNNFDDVPAPEPVHRHTYYLPTAINGSTTLLKRLGNRPMVM